VSPFPPAADDPPPRVSEPYKKRNGRPPYEPSDKDRERVKAMTAYGIPGRLTAQLIGCGYTTLHKYYREELDTAHIEATATVAQTA
jgi:hypothetical protein